MSTLNSICMFSRIFSDSSVRHMTVALNRFYQYMFNKQVFGRLEIMLYKGNLLYTVVPLLS